jgi:hypothetical protein
VLSLELKRKERIKVRKKLVLMAFVTMVLFMATQSVKGTLVGNECRSSQTSVRSLTPKLTEATWYTSTTGRGTMTSTCTTSRPARRAPIAESPEDEAFNGISGNIEVYTLTRFDDDIFVYDISTSVTRQITDPQNRKFARVMNKLST